MSLDKLVLQEEIAFYTKQIEKIVGYDNTDKLVAAFSDKVFELLRSADTDSEKEKVNGSPTNSITLEKKEPNPKLEVSKVFLNLGNWYCRNVTQEAMDAFIALGMEVTAKTWAYNSHPLIACYLNESGRILRTSAQSFVKKNINERKEIILHKGKFYFAEG